MIDSVRTRCRPSGGAASSRPSPWPGSRKHLPSLARTHRMTSSGMASTSPPANRISVVGGEAGGTIKPASSSARIGLRERCSRSDDAITLMLDSETLHRECLLMRAYPCASVLPQPPRSSLGRPRAAPPDHCSVETSPPRALADAGRGQEHIPRESGTTHGRRYCSVGTNSAEATATAR
jgi:hypothetical protein